MAVVFLAEEVPYFSQGRKVFAFELTQRVWFRVWGRDFSLSQRVDTLTFRLKAGLGVLGLLLFKTPVGLHHVGLPLRVRI